MCACVKRKRAQEIGEEVGKEREGRNNVIIINFSNSQKGAKMWLTQPKIERIAFFSKVLAEYLLN